ncbi:MAG: hypothetical protein R3B99_28210 [Polyangiales bacterium]
MRLLLGLVLLFGCVDTGVDPVELPVVASGVGAASFETRDGWTVTLDRADLAFGPLYLCTAANAGDLCETAQAEMLDGVVLDLLDDEPREIGRLIGLGGVVRSVMHDYGLTWDLTGMAPRTHVDDASMGDHSFVVEGVAERGDERVVFHGAVAVEPIRPGSLVVRRTLSGTEITNLADEGTLVVAIDPRRWLDQVRFDELEDGAIEEGTQAWRAVVAGMTAQARPAITWKR